MLRPFTLELEFKLDNKDIPMYQQLADGIQKLIVSGTLKPGDALPGSREMASRLKVSRKTVVSAMELLVFSGWLENRERIGLFVRSKLPIDNNSKKGDLQTESCNNTTKNQGGTESRLSSVLQSRCALENDGL